MHLWIAILLCLVPVTAGLFWKAGKSAGRREVTREIKQRIEDLRRQGL